MLNKKDFEMLEFTTYVDGQFEDYNNKTIRYILCGTVVYERGFFSGNWVKHIRIGASFCMPCDTFNDELGRKIAKGKAEKNWLMDIVDENDVMDVDVVLAILYNIQNKIEVTPGNFIGGYNKRMEKSFKDRQSGDLDIFKELLNK